MSAKLKALIEAAERFGDLRAEHDAVLRAWQISGERPVLKTEECQSAEWALIATARAYATSTRRKRAKAALPVSCPPGGLR